MNPTLDNDIPEKPRVTKVDEPRTPSAGAPGSEKAWKGGKGWLPGAAVKGPGGKLFVPGPMNPGFYCGGA